MDWLMWSPAQAPRSSPSAMHHPTRSGPKFLPLYSQSSSSVWLGASTVRLRGPPRQKKYLSSVSSPAKRENQLPAGAFRLSVIVGAPVAVKPRGRWGDLVVGFFWINSFEPQHTTIKQDPFRHDDEEGAEEDGRPRRRTEASRRPEGDRFFRH